MNKEIQGIDEVSNNVIGFAIPEEEEEDAIYE